MPKRYLALLTLVAAASYGLGEADLLEAQAISTTKSEQVCIILPTGASSTLDQFIQNQLCPQVDTDFNLTSGTCTTSLLNERSRGYNETWVDTNNNGLADAYRMCTHTTWPGEFVGNEP